MQTITVIIYLSGNIFHFIFVYIIACLYYLENSVGFIVFKKLINGQYYQVESMEKMHQIKDI